MAARILYRGGLPLTFRLLLALLVGSLLLSYVVVELASEEEHRASTEAEKERVLKLAGNVASRAAPLLAAKDDLRLATLAASVVHVGGCRLLLLDKDGVVRMDTGLAMGGRKLSVLSAGGPFCRDLGGGFLEQLMPAEGLHGLVGEVRVRYPDPAATPRVLSLSLFAGVFLSSLSLIALACWICHQWMLYIGEAVATARRLAGGELTASFGRRAPGVIRELQESLKELGTALGDGSRQAQRSLVELAMQMVEILERRGQSGHGERTRRYSMILADRLGLSEEECRDLELAARIHDLGEAWVHPSIYWKKEPLNDRELESLRYLPDRAADVLSGLPALRRAAGIVRHHRERYDGSGYPKGLRGDRIPLGARILGIADAYDQLTTCPVRGKPMSRPEALDTLRDDRGETFDPWLVDLFEEEMQKGPLPIDCSTPVMISTAGVLPYKAAQDGGGSGEDEEGAFFTFDEDLEVLDEASDDTEVLEEVQEEVQEESLEEEGS